MHAYLQAKSPSTGVRTTIVRTAKAVGLGLLVWAAPGGWASAQEAKQAPPQIDFRDMFLRLDVNSDTVLELDEIPEAGRPAFKKLLELGDTDKNGRLEAAELRAL